MGSLSCPSSLTYRGCVFGGGGVGVAEVSSQPVYECNSISLLSCAIFPPFCLGQAHPYSCTFPHSETPRSLSLECFLVHTLPLLSLPLYHPVWGPSFTLLSFLKSLPLSVFYSLLLCCIPVSVVKGVDKEEGGRRGRGNLSFREGGRERGKGGRRAPFFMRMPSAGSAERRTPA